MFRSAPVFPQLHVVDTNAIYLPSPGHPKPQKKQKTELMNAPEEFVFELKRYDFDL